MNKKQKYLAETEAEVTRHIGCRIKFYQFGKHHLGRIEACQYDSTWDDIAVWVKPADPAICNPWPRLKISTSNVVEILDNPHGYKEGTIPGH